MTSSSSRPGRWSYEVFLSFYGADTRRHFTDHLYTALSHAGVYTFRDDEELRRGGDISAELSKAIEESRISLIVFSKTYAHSTWCLNELVKILECKRKLNQVVLPIFYNVDPSEVRRLTGQIGHALSRHRIRFRDQTVDEWSAALTEAANISGYCLDGIANGYESKFIQSIVKTVLSILNHVPIDVAKHPVGLDFRVRDALDLLQFQGNDDNDVKMMGIFGMGGTGKTTIAKSVYNSLLHMFEGSCFIASIRSEVSMGHNGLAHLQEKLLRKTLGRKKFGIDNVDEGKSLIKARLHSKKVLVVLDDIDHISQLESLAGERNWFGSGSVVIITTRNLHLLSELSEHEKYRVETLKSNESLELLCWHAFGVPVPPPNYTELSRSIASYSGGLPLALTILGSHLRGRSVQEWSDNAEKLRRIPHDDVQKILKISYDALDDDTKIIFLDIACIFIGHDKKDVFHQENDSCFEIGIRTLTERCLLIIHRRGKNEKLQMHDLIRDMGREIVRKESSQDPSKRSRLVDPNDVFKVLQSNKGTEAITGMIVDSNILRNEPLATKVFSRMKNLQLLKLDGVHLRGSFKHLSEELRWFWWHNNHLTHMPSNFRFKNLEVLHLQVSKVKKFQVSMQHFKYLKILKLNGCEQLRKMPNFTGGNNLQILSFRDCSNLVQVHPSIGTLKKLVELDLTFCQKLKELPSSICKLESLELLYLDHCSSLQQLPINLGKLEQLRELTALSTSVSHLPFSLGCLRNLKLLSVGRHQHKDLISSKSRWFRSWWPRTTCDPVGFFPPSVANVYSLEALYISDSYLHEVDLPISLGELPSLRVLSFKGSPCIQSLPFSLCHLSRLICLELEECSNLKELRQLPPSLQKLSVKNCVSLENMADISHLERLRELYVPNCNSLVELPGLESLDSLRRLDITNCSALTTRLMKNWLPVSSGSIGVEIWVQIIGTFIYCTIPMILVHEFFDIIHGGFDPNHFSQPLLILRNKTSGTLITKKVYHVDCMCLKYRHPLTLHFKSEDNVVVDKSGRFHFEFPIKVGEKLEVYAAFGPFQILCLCEIHRNRDGQVCFFPSTMGFLDHDEIRRFARSWRLSEDGRARTILPGSNRIVEHNG